MAIAREDPAWSALAEALATVVRDTSAANAVVADVSENLWCRAIDIGSVEMVALDRMFALAMSTATVPLQRGGAIDVVHDNVDPFLCALSFAGIYLLLVWFDRPFDGSAVASLLRKRLPDIERLTVALPPDDPNRPAESASRIRRS